MAMGDGNMVNVGADRYWETEAQVLKQISSLGHPHLITLKAVIRKGGKCYFMFPWADGGTLREFYRENRWPKLDPSFVREIFQQLNGLADAVDAMHNLGHGESSLRHGDLKPENVLRFLDETQVGVWKIADMSLAKYHDGATISRDAETEMKHGTWLYEPPEVYTMRFTPRSRLYDIWSMGCIYLELLIWLLYGYDELTAFHNSLYDLPCWGSHLWYLNPINKVEVHPKAAAYMEHIARDPECVGSSAMRDLLDLIQTQLLVVNLPPAKTGSANPSKFTGAQSPPPEPLPGPVRADSKKLRSAFANIMAKGEKDEHYWSTGISRGDRQLPSASQYIKDLDTAYRELGFP
ncbi:kinase-like domain-containing protein [Xylaria sp. FL1777]|nr:kinase-like domain-containing protein [Xylaria sp. FL1777]